MGEYLKIIAGSLISILFTVGVPLFVLGGEWSKWEKIRDDHDTA